MSKQILGHQFGAAIQFTDGTDGKPRRYVDMQQCIKKPLAYARFSQYLTDDAVEIGYGATSEITASDNIVITDRSYTLNENTSDIFYGEESVTGISFSSYYKNLLLTDEFTEDIPSQPQEPLFYVHKLGSDVNTSSVKILDKNFNEVNEYSYKVSTVYVYDEDTGSATTTVDYIAVYNSYENEYDPDTGALDVYYVQYLDPSSGTDAPQIVLLSNEDVYHEAEFEDIWSATMKLKPWVKAYLVEYSGGLYHFTLPSSTTYDIKYTESARITLEYPAIDDKDFPWFLRVTNGSLTHNHLGSIYTYQISEFNNQNFNPIQPYKLSVKEDAEKVASGIARVHYQNLVVTSIMPMDIVVTDRDGSILHALTTDSSKSGTAYYDDDGEVTTKSWDDTKILGYDTKGGLVHLDITLKDYYTITATYYYEEKYYELTDVNMNPHSNSNVENDFYVIYVVPEASANKNMGAQEAAVHWLRVDENGIIVECSQDGSNGEPDIADTAVGMHYGRPPGVSIGASGDGVLTHVFSVNHPDSFIREYTLEAPAGFNGESRRYVILGEASVVRHTNVNNTTLLDTRKRGGGIKDEYLEDAKLLNPEIAWYGDVGLGAGLAFPGRGAVVVKLPYTVLADYGGRFEKHEIMEIAKRHIAFGHYPVIRYYGPQPRTYLLDNAVDQDGAVRIYWDAEDSTWTYNVYYGTQKDGIFTQHNAAAIANSAVINQYIIDGLTPNVVYWIYVTATVGGVEYPPLWKLRVVPVGDGTTYEQLGHEFDVTLTP